jgi:hypothetical protein
MNIIVSKWLIDNAETEEIWIIASYLCSRYTELPAPTWLKDEYYNRYIKNEC